MRPAGRKIALIAWELGAGRGHLEHLRPVVAALLRDGWGLVAAVRDVRRATPIFGLIDHAVRHQSLVIGQAPIFAHKLATPFSPPGSIAEILANSGFADASRLQPVVAAWEHLIDLVRPDLLLADFAPSAVIAARARMPVIMTGNGWSIPPRGRSTALLPIAIADERAAANAEQRILEAAANSSGAHWRPNDLSVLLRGDVRFIYTASLLDPYFQSRHDALSCPPNLKIFRSSGQVGPGLVYLPGYDAVIERVLEALAIDGRPVSAYLGGQQPRASDNVTVLAEPIDFATQLADARFFLHHGGLGVANWCLAHRIPQTVIPRDLEKALIGQALSAKRAGIYVPYGSTNGTIASAISRTSTLHPPSSFLANMAHTNADQTIGAIVSACNAAT